MTSFEQERVKLFHFTSFPSFQECLWRECEALSSAECDNLWIPSEEIGRSSSLAIEILIAYMYNSITKSMVSSGFAGVEFWVQKYEHGKGLAFHFDKDEKALLTDGTMKHPQFSSVVYLTGDKSRQRQAPTVVIDQLYDQESGGTVPDSPSACVLCWPSQGNILVFDGRHAHGVLESANMEDVRMTLLVNWWLEQPLDIPTPSEATGPTAEALASIQPQHLDTKQQLHKGSPQATEASKQLPCKCVFLKSLEHPIAVDEACRDEDVQLRGPDAVDAVCFQHPGMSLVPLEVAEGDDVDCAAALLPCDSESESD